MLAQDIMAFVCPHLWQHLKLSDLLIFAMYWLTNYLFNMNFAIISDVEHFSMLRNGLLAIGISFFIYYLLPLSFEGKGHSFSYWLVETLYILWLLILPMHITSLFSSLWHFFKRHDMFHYITVYYYCCC